MNIAIYSHIVFVRLICYCIASGFISGMIYCVFSAVLGLRFVYKYRNFRSVKAFLSENYEHCFDNSNFSDFISLVLVAASSLLASFMFNSGSFRLLIIPILLLGFLIATFFFKKAVVLSVNYIFVVFKRILGIAIFPFSFVLKLLSGVCKKYIVIIQNRRKAKIIAKYTEKRFKDLDSIKQDGLLGLWYEVVE